MTEPLINSFGEYTVYFGAGLLILLIVYVNLVGIIRAFQRGILHGLIALLVPGAIWIYFLLGKTKK